MFRPVSAGRVGPRRILHEANSFRVRAVWSGFRQPRWWFIRPKGCSKRLLESRPQQEKSQDHQTPSSSFFLPPSNKRLKMVLKKTKHSAMSSAEFRIFKRYFHPPPAQFSSLFIPVQRSFPRGTTESTSLRMHRFLGASASWAPRRSQPRATNHAA